MNRTDASALQQADDGLEVEALRLADMEPFERIQAIALAVGDISELLTESQLTKIGADCIADYEKDETDREDWRKTVEKAFEAAAQEPSPEKAFPWTGASNVQFPLLTTAALQFAARAYPAIVKGDEVVSCKVVGRDNGRPAMDQQGNPVPMMQMGPQGPEPVTGLDGQPQPQWLVAPGAKSERAGRVREYLNTVVFYRMKGWEEDTDAMLHQLPIAGCAFRKVWTSGGRQFSALVPALKLVAPMSAKDCDSAPRLTEVIESQSHNDVVGGIRAGFYRDVPLVETEEDIRPLLEQHCMIDLDEDGYAEPYIVTLDKDSAQVLRIEPDFAPEDVSLNDEGDVIGINRVSKFIKYDFFPNLEGGFYGTGLGKLLEQISRIVNNSINQMVDAGTAQAAGGGFIGSGVNLQGAGKRSGSVYFEPGEYKTVSASGSAIREAIYERTFPGPSPVTYQVLDMMLGAARDISSVKDVLTGEASNNGQVGTTLALIEQGLQVFTAIYKRIYRSLKAEFTMIYGNVAKYGGEAASRDYQTVLDDPLADFATDFNQGDLDIRPVSDPASVTKMQKMARASFLMQFVSAPGVDPTKIYRRAWEAADVEDPDDLLAPPAPPPQPDPKMMAGAEKDMASAEKYRADAAKTAAEAQGKALENEVARLEALAKAFGAGANVGMVS